MVKNSRKSKIIFVVICSILVFFLLLILWFTNDVYQDTPLEVLEYKQYSEEGTLNQYESSFLYGIKQLLDIIYIKDDAYIIYVSNANTFTCVECNYSKLRNKWKYIGIIHADEETLDNLDIYEDWANPYNVDYRKNEDYLYGIKINNSAVPYVNGQKAVSNVFEICLGAKTYLIDFWYMTGITNDDYVLEFK